jgi:GNAT superfamily N-acetyltransferase
MGPSPSPDAGRPARFGGGPYLLRALHPGDEGSLVAFFRSHAPETVIQRYGYLVGDLTAERAARLVDPDPAGDRALGIFGAGGAPLHAVGRYCLDPSRTRAEVAFVVRESKRNLGMASSLLAELAATARQRGLSGLWAQVAYDNAAMLRVLRRAGFREVPGTEAGVQRLELELGAPATSPASARRRPAP